MLSHHLLRYVKRKLKRSQTGQAIIILALGFVILLGFVGIVTDVSLLYIRYAALRRAVDSAAVAAAGQVRTDRALTAPRLAAIQFLEFHNVDTNNVFVETCADMPPDWQTRHNPADPENTPTLEQNRLYDEVCDNQRKLVRVTAYLESPTVFMSLPPFNFETITLSASAVSETASLDVVMVLDVSESMLFETTYDTWNQELFHSSSNADIADNQWARYLPPRFMDWSNEYGEFHFNLRRTFLSTYSDLNMMDNLPFATGNGSDTLSFEPLQYYLDDAYHYTDSTGPPPSVRVQDEGSPYFKSIYGVPDAVPSDDVIQMRPDCRVRIQPWSEWQNIEPELIDLNDSDSTNAMLGQYLALTGSGSAWTNQRYSMFRPSFNYFGCCNDPTASGSNDPDDPRTVKVNDAGEITISSNPADWGQGDFDFTDLVCQPFKQARDATRLFLRNVDFARGDRVAFVTFDRTAYLVDPDGYNYFTDEVVSGTTAGFGGGAGSHMIDSYDKAVEVLNRVIGVRAEPNFYWTDHIGGVPDSQTGLQPVDTWESFSRGTRVVPADVDRDDEIEPNEFVVVGVPLATEDDYIPYYANAVGTLRAGYAVRGSCPYSNAVLPSWYSIWSELGDPFANQPFGEPGPLYRLMSPPAFDPTSAWNDRYEEIFGNDADFAEAFSSRYSYEYFGSCRGTNIGAALREANNALVNQNTTRQEGTVWVIILLSDGAAGATDPIPFDETSLDTDPAEPYLRIDDSTGDTNYDPNFPAGYESSDDTVASDLLNVQRAEYGAYGFCPYGTPDDTTGITDATQADDDFVYCLDPNPQTRHFCNTNNDAESNTPAPDKETDDMIEGIATQFMLGNDRGSDTICQQQYDADDYARDWADYVAMDRQQFSGEQLPSVFTIGFNLDYPIQGGNACQLNLSMCLGEELLRYIANIGDNNEYNENEYPNTFLDPNNDAGVSYGNYYNAPDQEELGNVFDDIASKLFTRLAG